MPVLAALTDALRTGRVEVVDLTAPLHSGTPIIQLPPQFGQTAPFQLAEISRYDERGPAWYWNNFRTGEHTGTHFDAPNHWVTGQDGEDVSRCPVDQARSRRRWSSTSPPRARRTPTSCSRSTTSALGGRARPAARRRLAALPHRLGRPLRGPDGLPERRRDRPAHPGHLRRVRAMAGRGVAGDRDRRRDRRHRRRRGALLRPRVPVPLLRARRRQVRPHPAAEPRPAPRHRRGRDRRAAAHRDGLRQPGAGAGAGRAADGVRPRSRPAPSPSSSARARPAGSATRSASSAPATSTSRTRWSPPAPVRRGSARERRGDDGRRLRPHDRAPRGRHRAPGLRADQRDDRHRRGGEEPHAADRARGGPEATASRRTSTSTRPRWRRRRRGAERVDTPASAAADVRPGLRTAVEQRRTVVLNLPLDVQAAAAPDAAPAVPRPGPVRPAAVDELAGLLATRGAPGVRRRPRRALGRPRLRALGPRPEPCSRPPPSRTACSPTTPGRWASPAASPRRWPPS